MDTKNYEQIEIGEDIINEGQSKFLVENQEILLRDNKVLHNGSVLLNPIVFT